MLRAVAAAALGFGSVAGMGGCKSLFWPPPPHDIHIQLFITCIVFLTFAAGVWIIATIDSRHGAKQFKLLLQLARTLGIKVPQGGNHGE